VFSILLKVEEIDGEMFLVEYDRKNKTRAIIEKWDGE
jgi:hypothetical protein